MSNRRNDLGAAARHLRGLAEWQLETAADQGGVPSDDAPAEPAAIPTADSPPTVDKGAALHALRTETIGDCQRCKLSGGRRNIVFGVGSPGARVMFVGEGPGANEDATGEPFVGRAGQLLDKIIAAMGMRRDDVYIANIVKCRPPGNRDPEPDEVAECEPFLKQQIAIIQPEAIVALGRVAAVTLLRVDSPLGRLRARWHSYEGIPLMPTYHPAFLLRSPDMKRKCWEDIQQVMRRLNLEPPGRSR